MLRLKILNNLFFLRKWLCVLWFACFLSRAESDDGLYRPTPIDNPAFKLPPGVPRMVDTNGNVISIDLMFTTPEYQRAAFNLIIQEANRAVTDLGLEENSPINESNIIHAFISPFGYTYLYRAMGNIMTTNYSYNIKRDYKFSDLTIANYDDYFVKYRDAKYELPLRELNTNAAYQLATQWLTAAKMDVAGLNRDGLLQIKLSTDMLPGFDESQEKKTRTKISPVYCVWWLAKGTNQPSAGSLASVELFLPKKQLLQLSVNDPKYILRPALIFTNLESLFPGQAKITTYYPKKPVTIDSSSFGP